MSDILLRDCGSVCNDFSCTIGNWSAEKPGPGVEAENIMHIVCSECDRSLKSGGTQCETCGRWVPNRCGNVKAHLAKSGKWICDKCRSKRLRLLEEKLQNALLQFDDLTRRNKTLEEQLRLAAAGRAVGRRDTVLGHLRGGGCLVLGDSIIQNVVNEYSDVKFECFPGIRTERLHRVIKNRDLGRPDTVVIHVGTNDLRTRNLEYVMWDVYDVVNTAKLSFQQPE